MALRQQPQPEILHQVGVLVFVHQDVAELPVILRQHLRLLAQDLRHVQQQIAEIRGVQRAQPVLVARHTAPRARPSAKSVSSAGGHARGRQAAILPALDHRHQRRRRPALGVDAFGLHHLLQQAKLVVGVQDGEARRQPDQLRRGGAACARTARGTCRATAPRPGRPRMAPTRSRISRAALLVKVTASTWLGQARPVSRICAKRVVSTRVLPVPAPASTSSGPSTVSTALRCASFSRARYSVIALPQAVGAAGAGWHRPGSAGRTPRIWAIA